MGVQLGLDGSLKLETRDAVSIREVLDRSLDRYVRFAEAITHPIEPETVYWRIVFSILSVHTSFEANETAYLALREEGSIPSDWTWLTSLISVPAPTGQVVQFAGQKASYLQAFDRTWNEDYHQFMPPATHVEWRDTIDGLKGLARVKASFAVCLADPLNSNVICIDRHMARLLCGVEDAEVRLRVGVYDRAERRVNRLARIYDAPPFAVQWCLWDAQRGHIEPHESLRAA